MVDFKIPHQSRFLTTSNKFSAPFNNVPGKYSFTIEPSCLNQVLLKLQPSTVYFINTMSIGGNISENEYLESTTVDFPLLYVRKKSSNQVVYEKPIPISNFFDGNEASVFIVSDVYDEELLISLDGVLKQTAALVGVDPIILQVQFNIFAIESSFYTAAFRDQQDKSIGQDLRLF